MAYTINGQTQEIAPPIEQDGTTLLPLAQIIETMGGYVTWNNSSKEAIVEMDAKRYSVTVGDTTLIANGNVLDMPAAPVIENNRLYVPTDFFQSGLGCSVDVSGDDVTVSQAA